MSQVITSLGSFFSITGQVTSLVENEFRGKKYFSAAIATVGNEFRVSLDQQSYFNLRENGVYRLTGSITWKDRPDAAKELRLIATNAEMVMSASELSPEAADFDGDNKAKAKKA